MVESEKARSKSQSIVSETLERGKRAPDTPWVCEYHGTVITYNSDAMSIYISQHYSRSSILSIVYIFCFKSRQMDETLQILNRNAEDM